MLKNLFYMLFGVLAFIGAVVLIIVFSITAAVSTFDFEKFEKKDVALLSVPNDTVLKIDFSAEIPEGYQNNFSWTALKNQVTYPPFIKVLEAVKKAKDDIRIVGIYARLADNTLSAAQIEELREAVLSFRKSGKKAVIYAASVNPGLSDYYLASSFDEIWMPPHSMLPVVGVMAKFPFFKKLLNKIGVNPVVFAKYEYKGFMSSLVDETLPNPIRENMNKLLADNYETMIDGISAARGISRDKLQAIVNAAPLLAEEARSLGMIDKVLYRSQVDAEAARIFSNKINLVDIAVYTAADDLSPVSSGNGKIAYIVLSGEIKGADAFSELSESSLTDENVYKELQSIEKMPDLKGIILRIDSPGGAYDIADSIRYELLRLKKIKKVPVVASFGGTAASGGYFISTVADYVFADNLTVTGSIGAVSMRLDLTEGIKKLDVGVETLKYGGNADIFDVSTAATLAHKQSFDRMTTFVYNDFITKVGESRGISLAEMDTVARGRVFSGKTAVQKRLVNEVGGIFKAVDYLRKKTGAHLEVEVFPHHKEPWEIVRDKLLEGDLAGLLNFNKALFDFWRRISDTTSLMTREYDLKIN